MGAKHSTSDTTSIDNVREAHQVGGRGSKGSLQRREFSNALIARFRAKFSVGAADGCWLWQGAKYQRGYGMVCIGRHRDGTQHNSYAHRVAYVLAHGDIPQGSVVMHSCDVRACVNPAHLSLGTQSQNVADAAAKGSYRIAALARWARERKTKAA